MEAKIDAEFVAELASKIKGLPLAQQRLALGELANSLGHGGQTAVCEAFHRSPEFVSKGQREAATGIPDVSYTYRRGRKHSTVTYPNIEKDIKKIIQEAQSPMQAPKPSETQTVGVLTMFEIREKLKTDYSYETLPSQATMYRLLNEIGYRKWSSKKKRQTAMTLLAIGAIALRPGRSMVLVRIAWTSDL